MVSLIWLCIPEPIHVAIASLLVAHQETEDEPFKKQKSQPSNFDMNLN